MPAPKPIYRERATAIHGLHPSTKLVALALLFSAHLALPHPVAMGALAALGLALAAAADALPTLWRFRRAAILILCLSAVVWVLFFRAPRGAALTPLAGPYGPFTFYREQLLVGGGMGIRLASLLMLGLIFLAATRTEELAYGLERLGLPHVVAFTLGLSFRLVPLFVAAAETVREAQLCRGVDFARGTVAERVRKHLAIVVPVFLTALRGADQMAAALETKGFRARATRTSIRAHRFGLADAAALALAASVCGLFYAARLAGRGTVL